MFAVIFLVVGRYCVTLVKRGAQKQWSPYSVRWPGGKETPQVDADTNWVKGEGGTTPQASRPP